MLNLSNEGYTNATDFADYLVQNNNLSFREAYKVSAKLVLKYQKWIKSMGGNVADIYYIVKQHMRMKVFDKMKWTKQDKLSKFRAFPKLKKFSQTMDIGGIR